MKKLLYILTAIILIAGCNQDENVVSGIAASYYPNTTASAEEEDGIVYSIQIEASGSVGVNEGFVEIMIDSEVEGSIAVTDKNGNPVDVVNNRFTVFFEQDTVESGNGPRIQVIGSFGVEALNDVVPTDYEAQFVIVGAGGAITSVSATNVFTLKVEDADTAPIFSDDFENGLGQWTIINSDGNNTWTITAFNDNASALSSTFNSGNPGSEDNWLISPELNFDSFGEETLTFLSKTRFNSEENRLEVSILQNFDGVNPDSATQVILNPSLDPHEGPGFGNFTESGDIDLSSVTGSGYLAFRFKAVSSSDASGWEVDDVEISIFDADASGGGPDNIINLPFSTNFENCTTGGAIEENFIEVFASGAKTDRGWGCSQTGVDGSRAIRANAFGGSAGDEDAWLISAKRFNLSDAGTATLSFAVKSENDGEGTLKAYFTANYFGGDPTGFSWTELDISSQLPVKGSNDYDTVNVNLAQAIGRNVYIAFRFEGASAINSATFDIDNISVDDRCAATVENPVAAVTLPLSEDFGGGLSNWNIYNPDGNNTWGTSEFEGNTTALVSAFNSGGVASEDNWLISGAIDFDAQGGEELNFITKGRFNFEDNRLKVYILSSYDGLCDSSERTELTATLDPHSGSGFGTFTNSGAVDLSGISGTGYLAFRYVTESGEDTSGWELDDISLSGN